MGLTGNRTVVALAAALGTAFAQLGVPDPSSRDERFKENWKEFFRIRQRCYGFKVSDAIPGCEAWLERCSAGASSNVCAR
jgi:hypothetical protein